MLLDEMACLQNKLYQSKFTVDRLQQNVDFKLYIPGLKVTRCSK